MTTTEEGTKEETTTQTQETTQTGTQQTTTDTSQETTTNLETTTDLTTTSPETSSERPNNNGSSNCPPLGEGQAHFVCPTGFRRHPQNCSMFYQCTESPETSHLSIVTFNCPNGTVYDEDEIMCRDRKPSDNCASQMNDTLKTLFNLERNDSPSVSFYNLK